jgi:hypothetical protein
MAGGPGRNAERPTNSSQRATNSSAQNLSPGRSKLFAALNLPLAVVSGFHRAAV